MVGLFLIFASGKAMAVELSPLEILGENLFKTKKLSLYQNRSCKSCHNPISGYADPANLLNPVKSPVSFGADGESMSIRNTPSLAYAGFTPTFHWDDDIGGYVGGLFWDGSATGHFLGDPLAEQAQDPFLNPVGLAMPDKGTVVDAVRTSHYITKFIGVFGQDGFADIDSAYDHIATAIAAFERSPKVAKFASRFDSFWQACKEVDPAMDLSAITDPGTVQSLPQGVLTEQELQGLAIFNGKGGCANCHTSSDYETGVTPPLFTNSTYENLGVPFNPEIEEIAQDTLAIDYGLGGRDDIAANDPAGLEIGKFKVPTLRNIALTAPYGHNGYFPSLELMVHFLNTRELGSWEPPEVADNINTQDVGRLGLSQEEEAAIIAFLRTLSDHELTGPELYNHLIFAAEK